jgi:glycosyltransferase involved in cell wall biosynthesis
VAVILSRFPTVTETFILREIDEMERQGQPVRLVPLIQDDPPVVHEDARPWTRRALFTRFLSPRIVEANLQVFRRDPRAYLSAVGTLLAGTLRSPDFLVRSLALFPKAVYLARRLESEGIRHVHAHYATHPATVAWVIASLTDLTYSVTVHAHDIFVDRTFLEEKLGEATFVRVISDFNRDYLLSRLPSLDPAKVRVVHVGVDVDRYAATSGGEGEMDPRSGGEDPLVLSVASLRPYKGIAVLLEACYLLRGTGLDLKCAVAGDGPLREELEALLVAYGLEDRVRLLGAVPETTVRELLSRASVFVLPSRVQEDGQMDGIPVALMEAMAAGVPVVASDISGIPELVEDRRSGILVPPGNAEAVATAVRALLVSPGAALRMGARGRERVRRAFELEGTVTRLLELLEDHVGSATREVRERILSSDALSRHASSVGVRRVHEGRESWVAELLLGTERSRGDGGAYTRDERARGDGDAAWPRDVVLKVHRPRSGDAPVAADRARSTFETLRDLATLDAVPRPPARAVGRGVQVRRVVGASTGMTVPRPLHLEEEAGALLMTRCGGVSLLELADASRRFRDDGAEERRREAFRRAGAWLRAFHQHRRSETSAERALDQAVDEVLEVAYALEGRALEPADVRDVEQELEELRFRAGAGATAVARHGDFRPENVRVSEEDGLAVVGFEGLGPGHPMEDPAHFTLWLDLRAVDRGIWKRERVLETAFLEGYAHPSVRSTPAFELCRRVAAARLLGTDDGAVRCVTAGGAVRTDALLTVLGGKQP